jgi:very-short-patch-repair endonuclease
MAKQAFTRQQLQELQDKGKIKAVVENTPKNKAKTRKKKTKDSPLHNYVENLLIKRKIPYIKEYVFLPNRKFRFDFYMEQYKTAIEVEGIMSYKSRHTSVVGYSNDCTKYTLANLNGYKVIRITVINQTQLPTFLDLLNNTLL